MSLTNLTIKSFFREHLGAEVTQATPSPEVFPGKQEEIVMGLSLGFLLPGHALRYTNLTTSSYS